MKVLFICWGNICRSVSGQYIFQDLVNQRNLKELYRIDSAGISSEESGNPIYSPMKSALEKENIPIGNHHARQLREKDYEVYDLLIGMDTENLLDLKSMYDGDPAHKIHLLMEYTDHPDTEIDDPWYTGRFTECVQLLKEGCEGLLDYLERQRKSGSH